MKIPYIASYLAFHEAPVFMKFLDIQRKHCSHLTPPVILINDNGVWHPRRAGIASYFGVLDGIPCLDITKNVLCVDGIIGGKIKELLADNAPGENQYVQVIGDSGQLLGLAYNASGSAKNAVYISVGHRITLETVRKIFQSVTKYRIWGPTRQVDILRREMVTKLS